MQRKTRPACNKDDALKAWLRTEKSIEKLGAEVRKEYDVAIKTWLSNEYIEDVTESEPEAGEGFYLPHFPVIRRDNTTTKVRPVTSRTA